jgi:hypothetical protein
MAKLNQGDIDHLALAASEMIGFESGTTVAYDVAGYRRCVREPIEPQSLPAWGLAELGIKPAPVKPVPPEARFDERPYPARLAGFRRREIFGPDEIGSRFRELGIAFNDGLGNGLYESLLINRKYGLNHVLEAPILGFPLPYLKEEWPAFRKLYPRIVERWKADLGQMEVVYHGPLAQAGEKMVILWAQHYPLDLFAQAYFKNPQGIEREMKAELGFENPPVEPQKPAQRAALAKFWSYVQEKLSEILIFQADTIRQALGPGTQIVANPHELPVLDMQGQARAYEYPAVAIRPLLLDDPVFLRHYIAYFTQLFCDLTGKASLVSVRMNLSAATPRFIPDGELIRYWYDQAVRHGAGAFYFWTRDYPTCQGAYDGPIPGNPVQSTLPKERWEATLETLGWLSTHRRFQKPYAEAAILVPCESALLHREEWLRLYAAFSALAEARIHTRFLSDRQIERSGMPPGVRLLLAPVLEFVSPALRTVLEDFSAHGGTLLAANGPLYDREGAAAAPLSDMRALDEGLFDLFRDDRRATLDELANLAQVLTGEVNRAGLDPQSWVFDLTCAHLPPASMSHLRETDPSVIFAPWLYEHGSEWIMPFLKPLEN